jgi:alpha-1,6-mannosyltransferase
MAGGSKASGAAHSQQSLWYLAAALLLVLPIGARFISDRFVFGEGHAERPIGLFLILYGIGWIGFAMAAWLAWRGRAVKLWLALGVAVIARVALLDSNLIQSSDVYRYVLDGSAVIHGVNPYAHAPRDFADEAPERLREALATPEGERILSRVSYPEIRTIYPPLAQAGFAAGAWLTPFDWWGQRIVFTAFDVGTALVLLALLGHLQLPRAWIVLYAWNPLVLKEIVNAAHADSLAAFCLVAALYLAFRFGNDARGVGAMLCGVALGGAVLAKLYPLLVMPIFAAYLFNQQRTWRTLVSFGVPFALVIVIGYLPFAAVGIEALTEGFRRYTSEWQRNDGAYAIIAMFTPHARIVCTVLAGMIAIASAAMVLRREPSPDRFIAALQYTLLFWFLILPAPYPWYATALLALTALRPRAWAVVMTGALAIYYYSFIHEYRAHPSAWLAWSQALEHGAIWIAVAAPWAARRFFGKRGLTCSAATVRAT